MLYQRWQRWACGDNGGNGSGVGMAANDDVDGLVGRLGLRDGERVKCGRRERIPYDPRRQQEPDGGVNDSNNVDGTEVSGCDGSLNIDNDPSNASGWR